MFSDKVFDQFYDKASAQIKYRAGTLCGAIAAIAIIAIPTGNAFAVSFDGKVKDGKMKFDLEQRIELAGSMHLEENLGLNRLKQKDDAQTYYDLGKAKYASGDFKESLAAYNQSIRINPNYAPAYNNRGNVKDALEDYQGAIADYTESIRIDANYPFSYYNRGITKETLGDLDGAIADYTEAIRIEPNYPQAYGNRGLTKVELGDKKGALADLTEAAKIFKRQGRMEDYRKAMRLIEAHKLQKL
jgi:tetratricopeptide (TPR) repeat protein